jgi:hypothetical protein
MEYAHKGPSLYHLTIEDEFTQMREIHVMRVIDRGCPGFVLFLPTLRITLYCCANDRVQARLSNAVPKDQLDVMRNILREYNPHVDFLELATIVSFVIYLMEFKGFMSKLPAVVDVRDIRMRGYT